MNKYFAPNNGRFKILTNEGFSDFLGVTKTEQPLTVKEIILDNGATITTTVDHCIFIDTANSTEMGKLGIGDKVLYNNKLHTIVSIRYKDTDAVYDVLEVEKNHRFYVKSLNQYFLVKNCLYIDELGFVPAAEEFYESVYPTISSSDTSKVIITSTPKGLNFFYKMWIEAETGRNEYVAYDVKWFEHPDRDQAWYDSQVANLNAKSVDQEINCVAGDTKLNLNGESVTIKAIYDKYKKLNASDNKGVIYVQDVSYTIGK
jgi:hypothetical protein